MSKLRIRPKPKSKRWLLWLALIPILITSLTGLTQSNELVNYISQYTGVAPKIITNPYRPAPPAWPVASEEYHSKNIIVYDLSRKQILFRKNIDTPVPVASLTKIMTAILAIEKLPNLNDTTKVSATTINQMQARNASVAGFSSGEMLRYIDLLYGVILPSGGEASLTLAEAIASNETEFVNLMNARAKELNMTQTNFANSTGLDAKGQESTIRDLTRLLRYALKNPTFRQIFTTAEFQTSATNYRPQGIKLKHSILSNISSDEQPDFKILGGKSGTTYAAGLCWATLAQKSEREFLIITLGAPLDNLYSPTLYQKKDLLSIMQTIN
ncbi:MAG: D-alanyl-D-alanine carboxypeptidase family protein [Candidatus Nanosyncoccaceae bacterium]|jgi:D-alanyl-D-alanine carboxypeptidase (penicillin-binding protein 5/6)